MSLHVYIWNLHSELLKSVYDIGSRNRSMSWNDSGIFKRNIKKGQSDNRQGIPVTER